MKKKKCRKKGGRPAGMKLIIGEPEKVICLKCNQLFQSVDRFTNRICPECKGANNAANHSKFALQSPAVSHKQIRQHLVGGGE